MKKKIFIGLVGLLSLQTAVFMISCSQSKTPSRQVELSDHVTKVVYPDGTSALIETETGKVLIDDVEVDWIQRGKDTLAVFSQGDKRGFFNVNTGEIIVPPTYKHAWIFSEGLAGVVSDSKVGFINIQGDVVIDFRFPYYGNSLTDYVFHNDRCVVADSLQRLGVINTKGEWVLQPKYDYVSLAENYAVVGVSGGFRQIVDYCGNVIQDGVIDNVYDIYYDQSYVDSDNRPSEERVANNKYFEYKVCGRSGLMNDKGKFLTMPIYTNIRGLSPTLFRATLQDDESEVLINEKGEVLNSLR